MIRALRLFVMLALTCLLGGCGERDPNYAPSQADISDAVGAGYAEAGWNASRSAVGVQHSIGQMQNQVDAAMQGFPK